MKKTFPRAALAAALVVSATTVVEAADPLRAFPLHDDVRAAREAARRSGRPVALMFEAAWCPPCREFEDLLASAGESLAHAAEWAIVETDSAPSTADRFGIRSVPSLVILDPEGIPRARFEGVVEPDRLAQRFERIAASISSGSKDPGSVPLHDAPSAAAPGAVIETRAVARPTGFRGSAGCFSHVGYGPLRLASQSPFRAIRLDLRPHTPSTLGAGQVEASGRATWSNVWATGKDYFLDYETLRLTTQVAWGVTDRLEVSAEFEDASRFGGVLDGLTQEFHDLLGIDQNGRDLVPRGEFRFDLDPGGGLPPVSLGPGGKGSFSRGVTVAASQNLTCGTERAPAIAYTVSARVDAGGETDIVDERGIDLGASLAFARRVGRVFLYGTAGYTWYGNESFHGLPLDTSQISLFAAAEWSVASRHALIAQYLVTDGVVSGFSPFSRPSHEVTLGWKWEFRHDGLLEIGIIENVFAIDNGPDVGIHVGLARRF